MRLRALALAPVLATLMSAPALANEPLICVETGAVWVGPLGPIPYRDYDPPDPCLL